MVVASSAAKDMQSYATMQLQEKREISPIPRGIAPELLLAQVKNTVPFLFEESFPDLPYRQILLKSPLTHFDYFIYCLAAHHATVASFVPTDVDNQIRLKLWNPTLKTEALKQMAEIVLKSDSWDYRPVSTRWVASPKTEERISGHNGEWFSTAAGAYAALRRRNPDMAAEMAGAILKEISREEQVFRDCKASQDGIAALKSATLIAHNLGDLDRVMDLWNLPPEDPLRRAAYGQGHSGRLAQAGKLNKAYMAAENHRHFALRGPRCLRRSAEFLLPIGPFFDEWGTRLAKHPGLEPREVGEVVEAFIDGRSHLKEKTFGYPRAIAGILDGFPGGLQELCHYLPARQARELKTGELRTLCSVPRKRFEEQWNRKAIGFLKNDS